MPLPGAAALPARPAAVAHCAAARRTAPPPDSLTATDRSPTLDNVALQIAAELKVRPAQVQAAVELLDGGATVPFIARYRKEATDGLDDIQLRELEARLAYLRELEDRRAAVLKSIDEQGKLTPELRAAIDAAPTKQELEDLYLPYKPKRRTKGQIAREAGIEPLADRLFADPTLDPPAEAAAFVKPAGDGAAISPTVPRGARRRARPPRRALGRRRRAGAAAARVAVGRGPARSQAGRRQGRERRRRRQVPRLLRLRRADPPRALAPRAGGVPRPRAGILDAKLVLAEPEPPAAEARRRRRWPKAASRSTWAGATPAAPADDLIRKCVAWTWRVKLLAERSSATCSPGCAKTPRRSRSRSSPTTCATCCWPRRPARAW